ncbi:PD-(D/E)XK motif protein [Lichenicola sp.]|uniref:PD-(D/E)XK motif protein n=1 Tax=Lichenicola sp. TaxID=2804529 RepID=UPI003AFF9873
MSNPRNEELRILWTTLGRLPQGDHDYRAQRVRSTAPVSILAALRADDDAWSLVFEGPIGLAPRARTSFTGEGIGLSEDRAAGEGVFRLIASLEGAAFVGPFEALCADLIDVAEGEVTATGSLSALARRMATWMASLRRRGGLTDEAMRGLFGELCCLTGVAEELEWRTAITTWTGPDDGIHDITSSGGAWEVKASAGAGSSVWINGLDQLDDAGLSALVLVHVTMTIDPAGRSLRDLVQFVRSAISAQDPTALAEFERKLLAAGFLESDVIAETAFRVASTSYYRVVDGFPRILRSDVSIGVAEARYQLRVGALQPYRVEAAQALAVLAPLEML